MFGAWMGVGSVDAFEKYDEEKWLMEGGRKGGGGAVAAAAMRKRAFWKINCRWHCHI